MKAELRDISRENFQESGRLSAAAFYQDPAWIHILPEESQRRRITPFIQSAFLKVEIAHGARPRAAFLDGRLAGLALWFPPGLGPAPLWRWAPRLGEISSFLARPAAVLRSLRLLEPVDRLRPVDSNTWYLRLLAVGPAFQGKGVGGTLLTEGLQTAERERKRVYLETFNENNVAYYEKHGFAVLKKESGPGGPAFWRMLRPAIS